MITTTEATTTDMAFNETSTTEDLNQQFEEIFENLEDLSFEENGTISTTQKSPIKKRAIVAEQKKIVRKVICRHSRKFRSSRERWWFIAVSNCNGTRGIDLKYKILMTNGPTDDYWHHHFSADEFCKNNFY